VEEIGPSSDSSSGNDGESDLMVSVGGHVRGSRSPSGVSPTRDGSVAISMSIFLSVGLQVSLSVFFSLVVSLLVGNSSGVFLSVGDSLLVSLLVGNSSVVSLFVGDLSLVSLSVGNSSVVSLFVSVGSGVRNLNLLLDSSSGGLGFLGLAVNPDPFVDVSGSPDSSGFPFVGSDGLVGFSVSTLGLPGPSPFIDGLVGPSVSSSVSPGTVHVSVPDVADLHTGLIVPRIGNVEVSSSAPSSSVRSDTFSVSGRTPDPDAKSVVVGSDSNMRNSVPGKLVGWVETVVTRFGVTISDVHS